MNYTKYKVLILSSILVIGFFVFQKDPHHNEQYPQKEIETTHKRKKQIKTGVPIIDENIHEIGISFVILVNILRLTSGNKKMSNAKEAVKKLASNLGLQYYNLDGDKNSWAKVIKIDDFDVPVIASCNGVIDNFQVKIYYVYRTHGKSRRIHTKYEVLVEELPKTLQLYPENIISKIGILFGGQDIKVGDHEFDSKFVIKGNDERAIINFFTRNRKEAFINNLHGKDCFSIDKGNVIYEARKLVNSADALKTDLNVVLKFAKEIA